MGDQQRTSRAQPLPEDQHLIEVPLPEPLLVKGRVRLDFRFEADVALLARNFPDEFALHPNEEGFAAWEQGATFLDEVVRAQLDGDLAEMEGLKNTSHWCEPEIDFEWSLEQAKQLDAALGIVRE